MTRTSLAHTLRSYEQLIEIARDLAATLDLDALLQRITQVAIALTDAEAASILLYDEKKNELFFRTATNANNEALMQEIIVPPESLAGWVVAHRQPLNVSDVHQDTRFFKQVEQTLSYTTRSLIAVPMIVKDKLIGVLEVLNKKAGAFTPSDQELLVVLGAQAAVAIQNSRLFQQSDLISELVHELRTPLMSMNAVAYLLAQPQVSDEQRLALADTLQKETQRLNELSTNFLDLARLESGRTTFALSLCELNPLIEECLQSFRARFTGSGLKLETALAADLPPINADRAKIKQVLYNLLSNAIKYNRPQGQITLRSWYEQRRVCFSVEDSGVGMSPQDVERLFEKFFRASHTEQNTSGSGLGLSICKRLVEGHGGEIRVQSTLGKGTTFSVYLPCEAS